MRVKLAVEFVWAVVGLAMLTASLDTLHRLGADPGYFIVGLAVLLWITWRTHWTSGT